MTPFIGLFESILAVIVGLLVLDRLFSSAKATEREFNKLKGIVQTQSN